MEINFKSKLIDFDGKEGEPFENYVIMALSAPEKDRTELQQLDRFALALKIRTAVDVVDINLTEKADIMYCIHKFIAAPLITGRFTELLKKAE
jgi:hypothetical protein